MDIREKLDIFASMAMEEAAVKRNEILSAVERDYKKAIDAAERMERKKNDDLFMAESYKAQQLKNKEVIAASTEAKKKLVLRRNEMLEDLFACIRQRLEKFSQSTEYKDYLIQEIKKLSVKYDNLEITLMNKDMVHQADIERATGTKVKSASAKEDFIGGFTAFIPSKRAVIDCTLLSKFEYEQSNFNLLKINL